MIYYKAKGEFSFFGSDFIKDELITGKELVKWAYKQLKQGCSQKQIGDFIAKEFFLTDANKNHTFWSFGARFEKF